MSELRESAIYLHNLYEQEAERAKIDAEKEKQLREDAQARYDELRYTPGKIQEAYTKYKAMVKDVCFQYVIEALMSSAINNKLDERDQNMVHGLVENFIKTNGGASDILRRVKGNTYLIDRIVEEVEETSEEIIAKADSTDPNTFIIDKEDLKRMIDKLDKEDDFDEVKSAIAIRVTNAEDSFVDNCKAEKAKTEELLTGLEDRCKEVDADDKIPDKVKEDIKQEATREYKRKLNALNEAPKAQIFDEMVNRFNKKVLKENMTRFIIAESNKPNQERCINTVAAIYTLMETLSTSKLFDVKEEFINEIMMELS